MTDSDSVSEARQLTKPNDDQARRQLAADVVLDIVHTVPVLLWATDSTGYCIFLNKAWYEFTGLPEGSGMGDGWVAPIHEAERERVLEVFSTANEKCQPFEIEYRLRRADGQYRWVFDRGNPNFDKEGNFLGYSGSVMDFTERKRDEQYILLLQELTVALTQASTLPEVASVIIDKGCEVLGAHVGIVRLVSRDGQSLDPVNHQGMPEDVLSAFASVPLDSPLPSAEAVRTGTPVLIESREQFMAQYPTLGLDVHARLQQEAAAYLPLVIHNRIIGVFALSFPHKLHFDDKFFEFFTALANSCAQALERVRLFEAEASARHLAEQRAERLQQLHSVTALLSGALTPEHVARVIVEQGVDAVGASAGSVLQVVSVDGDPQLEILSSVGYPTGSVDSWRPFPLSLAAPLTDSVRTRTPIWLPDKNAVLQYAPTFSPRLETHHAWAALPLVVDDRVIGALGLSFDTPQAFEEEDRNYMVSLANHCAQALERARLFEETQQARQLAEQAVRTRDEFLALASHELKNPLSGTLGNAQLLERRLKKEYDLQERDQKTLQLIISQSKRLNTMIEQLLDLSRLDKQVPFQFAPLDVSLLVHSIVAEVEPTLQNHSISVQEQAANLIVKGDMVRLSQVLHNLLSNAVKYSPEGGTVGVTVDRQNGHASIAVTDQGIGIPKEELPNLFGRFYRVPNAKLVSITGFGIGLYVVKAIIARHGGTITVDSTPGVGSTFTVLLPLSTAK